MARITMPQLGETVTEGTVTRWLKQPGDHVGLDEPLLEVATDKVETEIPSAFEGTLTRLVVDEGATVPIGTLLAVIGDEDVPAEDLLDDYGVSGRHRATRSFRRAMEGGVGSIHRPLRPRDRDRATSRRPSPRSGSAPTGSVGSQPQNGAPPSAMGSAAPIDTRDVARRVPHSVVRKRTAEHLTASIRTAAHTLTVAEVDYTAVEAAREEHRDAWRDAEGFGLSYLPFIARAVCDALAEYPLLNSSVDVDDLVVHASVNLGVAVDLDFEGLVVPVVHRANELRLAELARAMRDLAGRARVRDLSGDDTTGGTFTITNAGGYGTFLTAPLINPPQVAILSTDGVSMRPVAVTLPGGGYGVGVHPVGNLALSFDHRAVDGAYASAFLATVRQSLQERDWSLEVSTAWPDESPESVPEVAQVDTSGWAEWEGGRS